jgi:hypothetical protein
LYSGPKIETARHGFPKKGAPPFGRGQIIYRFISTSTPGRRSLLISTSGSLTRRRSSIVTSGSRTPLPTVTSGVRVQFSPHSGPTQFRSHTSAALAGSDRRAEPVNAAARAKARAVRISNLHDFDARQRPGRDGVPRFRATRGIAPHAVTQFEHTSCRLFSRLDQGGLSTSPRRMTNVGYPTLLKARHESDDAIESRWRSWRRPRRGIRRVGNLEQRS